MVKTTLIGMTGAWISKGVEWYIPHHHRATPFTAVDYTVAEQADESKTVWVGETEWSHRTCWVVRLTLRQESTLLETTKRVFNNTPYQNSLLVFTNASVHANEDCKVILPPETQWTTYHLKNQFSQWAINYQRYDGWDYSDGVDVISERADPLHYLALSYIEMGNKEEVYALFYRASRDSNSHTPVNYQMPLMKSRNGEHQQADAHLREAYKTNIRSVDVLSLKASLETMDNHSRSEEHTSELQSRGHIVCRLLLEKKNICIYVILDRFAKHSYIILKDLEQ